MRWEMINQFRTWDEVLIESLADPEESVEYIDAYIEGYLEDGDKPFFIQGMKNVVDANRYIFNLSDKVSIKVKPFLNAINGQFMPTFEDISSLVDYFKSLYLADNILSQESPNIYKILDNRKTIRSDKNKKLTERQSQNIQYWKGLDNYVNRQNRFTYSPSDNISSRHDLKFGVKGFSLRASQTIKRKSISAALVLRGKNLIRNFYSLRIQDEEVEKAFGNKLEWWSKPKSEKRIYFVKHNVNPANKTDWYNQYEWLYSMLDKLYTVFYPRISSLVAYNT
ncbi:DUF4268 domain-containing protein [Candidatus Poribacteria bacterium]|nr:DUF4268 domain-containing protein [Candidatus Poribacteria bacterium]